eukprot:SAG31_NODE_7646_length_1631_cov_1.843342_1_plen_219_part_10
MIWGSISRTNTCSCRTALAQLRREELLLSAYENDRLCGARAADCRRAAALRPAAELSRAALAVRQAKEKIKAGLAALEAAAEAGWAAKFAAANRANGGDESDQRCWPFKRAQVQRGKVRWEASHRQTGHLGSTRSAACAAGPLLLFDTAAEPEIIPLVAAGEVEPPAAAVLENLLSQLNEEFVARAAAQQGPGNAASDINRDRFSAAEWMGSFDAFPEL